MNNQWNILIRSPFEIQCSWQIHMNITVHDMARLIDESTPSTKYPQSKKYIWNPNHCGYLPFFPRFPNKNMVTSQTYTMSLSTHPKNTQQIMNLLQYIYWLFYHHSPFFCHFSPIFHGFHAIYGTTGRPLRRAFGGVTDEGSVQQHQRGGVAGSAVGEQHQDSLGGRQCHHQDPPWKMGWLLQENLNRKPWIFPWRSWDVPVIFPLNQSIEPCNPWENSRHFDWAMASIANCSSLPEGTSHSKSHRTTINPHETTIFPRVLYGGFHTWGHGVPP